MYEEKFVAFVDILGFKEIVEASAANNDPEPIVRMLGRLGPINDIAQYHEYGGEICPESPKQRNDLSFTITQVSDCVIVSAEVSPAGGINIVNFCRKVSERLLQREGMLCRGYIAMGKVYHKGQMIFGPAYQNAVEGEKNAAAIEWRDGSLGTPFIEIDCAVSSYFSKHGDQCTCQMFARMTKFADNCTYISPYKIFERCTDWIVAPGKSQGEMRQEVLTLKQHVCRIEEYIAASHPLDERARVKVDISLHNLAETKRRLDEFDRTISAMTSLYPSGL